MSDKSWQLNRRQLIKGGGIALALPLLNGMLHAQEKKNEDLPKRLVVTYFAYGCYMPGATSGIPHGNTTNHHDWSWWPCMNPGELSFNKSSESFAPLKNYLSYFQGLDHKGGYNLGGHSSGDVFATGADMVNSQKTNDISIDQLAVKYHGHKTRHPSLVLGTEGGTGSYCQTKTLSHYGPGRPIPSLASPSDIFNRLFLPYGNKSVAEVRAQLKRDESILDKMMAHSKTLNNSLGKEDKTKMEEYLESIRALEARVKRSQEWLTKILPKVDINSVNLEADRKNPQEYIRCMYDLIYLALQTDSTRYATFMTESEHSSGTELWNYATYALGYKGATHDIAHKKPEDFSGLWDKWRADQHAYFLNKLKETKEADGNMLDNTVVIWGSAHPHESHSAFNYPIQIAGGNKLGLKHGKLNRYVGDKKVPLTNLYLSLLNTIDVPVDKFADSTGKITEILA